MHPRGVLPLFHSGELLGHDSIVHADRTPDIKHGDPGSTTARLSREMYIDTHVLNLPELLVIHGLQIPMEGCSVVPTSFGGSTYWMNPVPWPVGLEALESPVRA